MDWENNIVVLAVASGGLLVTSHVLEAVCRTMNERQELIKVDLPVEAPNQRVLLFLKQIAFAAILFGCAYILDGVWIPLFAGGYAVTALAGASFSVHGVIYGYALNRETTDPGKISLSTGFNYANMSGKLVGLSLLMFGLYGLFGKFHFVGAGVMNLSAALGYWLKVNKAEAQTAGEA